MAVRVAVYTDASGIGGAEISLGHLVAHLPADIDVTMLGCNSEVVDHVASRRPGTPTVLLPLNPEPGDPDVAEAHEKAVADLQPDILHANLPVPWLCWYGIGAGLACPGTAVVAVEQLPIKSSSGIQRWWKRRQSSQLAAHVAVGAASARETEQYAGLPPGSVRSIHNGVPDLGPVEPIPHDGVVIVAVGRLNAQKGFDVLLEALTELPDVTLLIVGGGEEHDSLAAQAAALEVDDRVTITGWTRSVREHLARADVFVLPSRSEGFPLAIAEAMQAGLPVVATDVGSVPEAVIHGETGILVPKDDPRSLAAALGRLVEDPTLRARMGRRGREVGSRFTAERMAREFVSLWQEVAGRVR